MTEYRITTYSDTPFLGTHYSVDKKTDGAWFVYSLHSKKYLAEKALKVLTGLNEAV